MKLPPPSLDAPGAPAMPVLTPIAAARRRPPGRLPAALALGLAGLLALPAGAAPAAPVQSAAGQCRAGEASFFRDEGMTIKVATRLQWNKALLREKIDVKVTGGVATLSGNVSIREHVALAGRIAAETEGVSCVNNMLTVGAG